MNSSPIRIPFLDIGAQYAELREEIDEAVARVLRSGWYVLGEELEAFEREFATYCGAAHGIGVANGLDALYLALRAVGVSPGDEVIVPGNTFIATWLAVSQCGAIPVPVDPDPHSYNIDWRGVERAITTRTKAIVPVHLYGQPADLEPLVALARKHGLRIVEDAAQAHGAAYCGRRIGAHSDAVAWSFYPGKNLGAFGDGGAVTTSNPGVNEAIRILRNYGSRQKYVHEARGINSRLDPLQAAILRVKLRHLDEWNSRRASAARVYTEAFANSNVAAPEVPAFATPVWHLYVIRCASRDRVQSYLSAHGIQALIHYPIPPHRQAAYSAESANHRLPLSESLAEQILSLPIGPHLLTRDVEEVAGHVLEAMR